MKNAKKKRATGKEKTADVSSTTARKYVEIWE